MATSITTRLLAEAACSLAVMHHRALCHATLPSQAPFLSATCSASFAFLPDLCRSSLLSDCCFLSHSFLGVSFLGGCPRHAAVTHAHTNTCRISIKLQEPNGTELMQHPHLQLKAGDFTQSDSIFGRLTVYGNSWQATAPCRSVYADRGCEPTRLYMRNRF